MKATIKRVSMKTVEVKATGVKFDKVVITCDVHLPDSDRVLTKNAEMSVDWAKKYFGYCGLSSRDLPGMPCEVTMQKRAFTNQDGIDCTVNEIKYLNMLDADGKPIILRKEPEKEMPF